MAAHESPARVVPVPRVEGPVPGAPSGDPSAAEVAGTHPWLAATEDLAAAGWVEQEFLVGGVAEAYDDDGGHRGSGVPYRSRVVVRRPAAAAFSGTVLVEWLNVSSGFDADVLWDARHCVRAGHCWVGVSAQRTGVDALRSWSPARYGDLDVTGGGRFADDELSYNVFAQVAAALREGHGGGLLGPLTATTLLAVGASQSAAYVADYHDHVRPLGTPTFDGYACVIGPAPLRAGPEPVFSVLSETDVPAWWPGPSQDRADSDRFRRWEVAGTSHSDWHGWERLQRLLERDGDRLPTPECARPPFSRVPLHQVVAAAFDHLARWARGRSGPPVAEPLRRFADGQKVRDELGRACGGIRLAELEVPVALDTGENSGPDGAFLCGSHEPLTAAQLAQRYPTRSSYVRAFARAERRNVRAGHLHPDDARDNLRAAARRELPEVTGGQ